MQSDELNVVYRDIVLSINTTTIISPLWRTDEQTNLHALENLSSLLDKVSFKSNNMSLDYYYLLLLLFCIQTMVQISQNLIGSKSDRDPSSSIYVTLVTNR